MPRKAQNQVTDLDAYSGTFLTVKQLSDYWNVSRKYVHKLIESGDLQAVRFGPRTQRIAVQSAMEFERRHENRGKLPPET